MIRTLCAVAALSLAIPLAASAETASYTVVFGGKNVGHLIADTKGAVTTIDFDIKNNGRGPTDAGEGGPLFHGYATHDWKTGKSDAFDFGASQLVEEAVFVARPGGSEELDGWLLAPSVNLKAKATELHVFDARRVAAGPVCTWRADRALPVSLHGAFVAA